MSTLASFLATPLPEEQPGRLQPQQAQRTLHPMAPLRQPPRISWPELRALLRRQWKPGEHWTLLGPTGSGKTHAAQTLASLCRYTLTIATKRKDPLLDELARRQKVIADPSRDILWAGNHPLPEHSRVIFWPKYDVAKMSATQREARQAAEIRKALDWADRTGGWAIVIDELMWLTRNLGLERELNSLYFQARTQGVSMIGAAQRPRQVPLLALNQSTYLLLWNTSDKQDLERLRELSAGFPRGFIESAVQGLNWHAHEALFIDARTRSAARVVMPAKVPV